MPNCGNIVSLGSTEAGQGSALAQAERSVCRFNMYRLVSPHITLMIAIMGAFVLLLTSDEFYMQRQWGSVGGQVLYSSKSSIHFPKFVNQAVQASHI